MSFPHWIKAKVWAELTMLRMKKKGREMAFQLCNILEHKRERKHNLKRTIKVSVWSHLYKTGNQNDEAICREAKEDGQVKETTEGPSNILQIK